MIDLPKKYKEKGFSFYQLKEIELGFEHGLDSQKVDLYAKIEFDNLQMKEIRLALEDGFSNDQIDTFARPECNFKIMEHAREVIKNANVIDETKKADLHKKRIKNLIFFIGLLIIFLGAIISFLYSQTYVRNFFQGLNIEFKDISKEIEYGSKVNAYDYIKSYTKGENIKLEVPKTINTHILGEQTLNYVISNDVKKVNKKLKIKIVDKEKPIVKLKQYDVTLERSINTTFSCKSYLEKATDNVDGDITEKVSCNAFDVNKDKQDIIFKVKDSSNNEGRATLKLILKEKEVPKTIEKIVYVPDPTKPSFPNDDKVKGVGRSDYISKKFLFKDGYNMDSGYKACLAEGNKYGNYTCTPIQNKEKIYIGYELQTK